MIFDYSLVPVPVHTTLAWNIIRRSGSGFLVLTLIHVFTALGLGLQIGIEVKIKNDMLLCSYLLVARPFVTEDDNESVMTPSNHLLMTPGHNLRFVKREKKERGWQPIGEEIQGLSQTPCFLWRRTSTSDQFKKRKLRA